MSNQPGQDTILQCPFCGGENLHQCSVEVWQRVREDAELEINHVKITEGMHYGEVTIDSEIEGNPSQRRDGVAVGFWCETCPFEFRLLIWQHKGTTFQRWLRRPRHEHGVAS